MFSLESPHRGDSNEYTKYTIIRIKKKCTLNYPKYAAMGFFSKGLKNAFETAVVNETSMFKGLLYMNWRMTSLHVCFRRTETLVCGPLIGYLLPSNTDQC